MSELASDAIAAMASYFENRRHHVVNRNGAAVHSTDSLEAAARWGFDYLNGRFTVQTTVNGKAVIERCAADLEGLICSEDDQ